MNFEEIVQKNIDVKTSELNVLNAEIKKLNSLKNIKEKLRSYVEFTQEERCDEPFSLEVSYIFFNNSVRMGKGFKFNGYRILDEESSKLFSPIRDLLVVEYNPKDESLEFPFTAFQPAGENEGEPSYLNNVEHYAKGTKPKTKSLSSLIDAVESVPSNVEDSVKILFERINLKEGNIMLGDSVRWPDRHTYYLMPKDALETAFANLKSPGGNEVKYFIEEPVISSVFC